MRNSVCLRTEINSSMNVHREKEPCGTTDPMNSRPCHEYAFDPLS